MSIRKLVSTFDGVRRLSQSVNFIFPYGNSLVETRYVRREKNKVSVYVSSHNGCIMGCKVCHLTALGETNFKHVDIETYNKQLEIVLEHANKVNDEEEIKNRDVKVNINMMARGEALANKNIIHRYGEVYRTFDETVKKHDYRNFRINISTIMPQTMKYRSLVETFGNYPVYLYYSLYSLNENFRKKWFPKGMKRHTSM